MMMTNLHCKQRLSLLLNLFYGEHFQSTRILITIEIPIKNENGLCCKRRLVTDGQNRIVGVGKTFSEHYEKWSKLETKKISGRVQCLCEAHVHALRWQKSGFLKHTLSMADHVPAISVKCCENKKVTYLK